MNINARGGVSGRARACVCARGRRTNRNAARLNNKHACDEAICVINIDLAPA